MTEQFWHNLVTDKSFFFLRELRRNFKFVLIGGWAVYFYTKALKSKDIDIVVDFEWLGKIRQEFDLIKNERLKKYEIHGNGFDVDIYVPHWSELGIPAEKVIEKTSSIEGFRLPAKETLLALKLFVYTQRRSSLKGKKDLIDIISLLFRGKTSLSALHNVLKSCNRLELLDELKLILKTTFEIKELHLDRKKFSDFKKALLLEMEKLAQSR